MLVDLQYTRHLHGGSEEGHEYRIAGLGADILTWDFHNLKQECYSLDLDNRSFNNNSRIVTSNRPDLPSNKFRTFMVVTHNTA
jgi:hypothetical protein